MPRFPKGFLGANFWHPFKVVRLRGKLLRKNIADCTIANMNMLILFHEQNPTATISELKEIISDRNRYVYFPECIEILDKHIKEGLEYWIPDWRYN